jgi:hypothetical protein
MTNTLRIMFGIAAAFGIYKMTFTPPGGPLTTAYRSVLIVVGVVGLICLEVVTYLKKRKEPEQEPPSVTSPIAKTSPVKTAPPPSMGDSAGTRRLFLIVIGLIIVGSIAALIFILTR